MKTMSNKHLLTSGQRVKVTTGPQRGQGGVIDKCATFVGVDRFRVTDPDTRTVVGWFDAAHLTLAPRNIAAERTERDALGLRLLRGEA